MPKEHEVGEIIARLRREGWSERPGKGSHRIFTKDGKRVSVPTSRKELPVGTYRNMAKAAGWL